MLREHAPLIAVSTVAAILFYLLFRDLRAVHAALAHAHVGRAPVVVEDAEDAAEDAEELTPPPAVPGVPAKHAVVRSNAQKKV